MMAFIRRYFHLILMSPILGQYIPFTIYLDGFGLTPDRILVALILIGTFVLVLRDSIIRITRTDVGVIFVLLFLVSSAAWSISPEVTVRRGTNLLLYVAYFAVLITYFGSEDDLSDVTDGILLVALVLTVSGIIALLLGVDLRYGLLAETRNELGRVLIASLPFAIISTYHLAGLRRWMSGFVSVAILFLIPISGSRSAVLAMMIMLPILILGVVYLQTEVTQGRLITLIMFVGFGSIFMIWVGLALGIFPSRIATISQILQQGPTPELIGQKRYDIYLAEIAAIKQYWMVGMGYGAFTFWTEHIYGINSHHAHDLLSRIWLGGGIIPLSIFISTYAIIIQNYTRFISHTTREQRLFGVAGLIGLLGITMAGLLNIVITELMFYVLLALGSNFIPKLMSS